MTGRRSFPWSSIPHLAIIRAVVGCQEEYNNPGTEDVCSSSQPQSECDRFAEKSSSKSICFDGFAGTVFGRLHGSLVSDLRLKCRRQIFNSFFAKKINKIIFIFWSIEERAIYYTFQNKFPKVKVLIQCLLWLTSPHHNITTLSIVISPQTQRAIEQYR